MNTQPFPIYADNELDTNFPVREGHTPPSGPDLVDLDVLSCFDLDLAGNYCTRLRQMDLWQPLPDDQLIKVCDKVLANGTIAFTVYTSPQKLLMWDGSHYSQDHAAYFQNYFATKQPTPFQWSTSVVLSNYKRAVKHHQILIGDLSPKPIEQPIWDISLEQYLDRERESGRLSLKNINQEVRTLLVRFMDYGIQHKLLAIQNLLDSKPVFLNHLDYYGYSDVAEGLMGGGGAYFLHQDYRLFHVETWIC